MFNLKNLSKKERSWITYDIANSAYVLTVITIFFPILYKIAATKAGLTNDDLKNSIFMFITSGIAFFVAFLSPILGSIANYRGNKKKFFKFFLAIGIIGGFCLAIPGLNWIVLLVIFIISSIGYNSTNVFYDAFLVDVTDEERMDEVSSIGFGLGYIGSLIPFFIGIIPYALILFEVFKSVPKDKVFTIFGSWNFTAEWLAICFAFIVSCIWWGIFSLPIIRDVEQTYSIEKEENPIKKSFIRLRETFSDMSKYRDIMLFMFAYLLYIDVVNSVIRLATTIGGSFEGVRDEVLLGVIVVVQVIAFPCAIIYGKMTKVVGAKNMLFFGIFIYALLIVVVSLIGKDTVWLMWVVAVLVGSAQGGIQAVSRSYFARMVPMEKANEFFGVFGVFGKFSGIFSPFILGLLTLHFGTNIAIFGLFLPLIVGAILLALVTDIDKEKLSKKEKEIVEG